MTGKMMTVMLVVVVVVPVMMVVSVMRKRMAGRWSLPPGRIGVEWDRSDLTPPPHTHRTCEVGPYTLH